MNIQIKIDKIYWILRHLDIISCLLRCITIVLKSWWNWVYLYILDKTQVHAPSPKFWNPTSTVKVTLISGISNRDAVCSKNCKMQCGILPIILQLKMQYWIMILYIKVEEVLCLKYKNFQLLSQQEFRCLPTVLFVGIFLSATDRWRSAAG